MARVLIVDDAGFIRRWCSSTLTERGHLVIEAENGADGVKAYRDWRPDAVLLDVHMRIMDGLTALQEIRRVDPQARVVMLTGEGDTGIVMQARRLGARDFVVKPCQSTRLIDAVERALG